MEEGQGGRACGIGSRKGNKGMGRMKGDIGREESREGCMEKGLWGYSKGGGRDIPYKRIGEGVGGKGQRRGGCPVRKVGL